MAPLHMATGTLDGAPGISANQGNPHGHGKLPRSLLDIDHLSAMQPQISRHYAH